MKIKFSSKLFVFITISVLIVSFISFFIFGKSKVFFLGTILFASLFWVLHSIFVYLLAKSLGSRANINKSLIANIQLLAVISVLSILIALTIKSSLNIPFVFNTLNKSDLGQVILKYSAFVYFAIHFILLSAYTIKTSKIRHSTELSGLL